MGDPRVDRGVRRRVTDTAVDLNAAEINDRNAIPDRTLPRSHNSIPPKVYPECTVFHAAIDSFETSSAHCNHVSVAPGAVAGLVGIKCGVVSGVINLESSGVEAVGLETTP